MDRNFKNGPNIRKVEKMTYTFKTKDLYYISNLEMDGNVIKKVDIINGCDGNSKGIAKLAGMTVEEVKKLSRSMRQKIHLLPGSIGQGSGRSI